MHRGEVVKPVALTMNLTLCRVFICLLFFAVGCSKEQETEKKSTLFLQNLFGTDISVKLYGDKSSEAVAEIKTYLEKLHDQINIFDQKSELAKLNKKAFSEPVVCSLELWDLLVQCQWAHQLTDGHFDVSAGPLLKLWGFHGKRKTIPTQQEIGEALKLVGFSKIKLNKNDKSVQFPYEGMYIDVGGIAKGYALDKCVAIARKFGIKIGIIDLGGNIYCFENVIPGRKSEFYNIGIRSPAGLGIADVIQLKDSYVATSGDYERFNVIDGVKYAHIVSPKTGLPVKATASVSVVTNKGLYSDIFSTAIFVSGETMLKKLRTYDPALQALIIKHSEEGFTIQKYGEVWN